MNFCLILSARSLVFNDGFLFYAPTRHVPDWYPAEKLGARRRVSVDPLYYLTRVWLVEFSLAFIFKRIYTQCSI